MKSQAEILPKFNPEDGYGVIDKQYTILTEQPIPALATEFCDAYQVSYNNEATQFYALCFKSKYPVSINSLKAQASLKVVNYIAPVAYGITAVAEGMPEQLAAILPMPIGTSLKALIANNAKFDKDIVIKKITPIILNILKLLHAHNITHGSINLNTLHINKQGQIIISSNLSAPIGYSQPAFFESPERAQCTPYGKLPNAPSADYYALGMLLFTLLTGRDLSNLSDSHIISTKLGSTSFNMLYQEAGLEGELADLIKGLVSDDVDQRWDYSHVEQLLGGKAYPPLKNDYHYLLQRPILFNGKEIFSKKLLAYEMQHDWEAAKELIESEKIRKWLEGSVQGNASIQILEAFIADAKGKPQSTHRLISASDEKMIKMLIALDPEGPIRYKNIAFFKEAVGLVLAISIASSKNDVAQNTSNLLYSFAFGYYEQAANVLNKPHLAIEVKRLRAVSEVLKKTDIGFGLERAIYDLNPEYFCQLTGISNKVALTVLDVLNAVEHSTASFNELFAKKAITSFIASKVGLEKELRLANYDNFPNIQRSKVAQILLLLSLAQKEAKIPKLIRTCRVITKGLVDLFETYLSNIKTTKSIREKLESLAETGDIEQLMNAISDSAFVNKDIVGYSNAVKRCVEIEQGLKKYHMMLSNSSTEASRIIGLQFAVKFTYIILMASIVMLVYFISQQ